MTYAINKNRILSYIIDTAFDKRKKTLKTFKINIELLIIMSSHRNKRKKFSFPSFLFWPPSIAHTLSP